MSYSVSLPERGTFEAWRAAARLAISHRIPPDQIDWTGSGGLFAAAALPDEAGPHQALVPEAFVKLAGSVIWHSAPERLSLLYQALWRIDRDQHLGGGADRGGDGGAGGGRCHRHHPVRRRQPLRPDLFRR